MSRRNARALALQVLFHTDLGHAEAETALFQAFAREHEDGLSADLSEDEAEFARELVLGAWEHKDEIDAMIAQHAVDWSVERMAVVDRNILRVAIYEIRYRQDVPASVAADEAVELAKTYSTADSGKFINGILGSVIRKVTRPVHREGG